MSPKIKRVSFFYDLEMFSRVDDKFYRYLINRIEILSISEPRSNVFQFTYISEKCMAKFEYRINKIKKNKKVGNVCRVDKVANNGSSLVSLRERDPMRKKV